MLASEKILVTGATGTLGTMFGKYLAQANEVWGLARYADPIASACARADGLVPIAVDLENPDFSALPTDFTYLIHLAHTRKGADAFAQAVQINAIGPGLLLHHCRQVKAALIVSSTAVYTPAVDVWHPLAEHDPIGGAFAPWSPTSPVSKVSLEAVAQTAAVALNIPTIIMRLNTTYGPGSGGKGGMPVGDLDTIIQGKPVQTFADPYPHSPIHFADMCDQLEALLDAASTPAPIINWCGDEIVTQRQWCEMAGQFSGRPVELKVQPIPGAPCGNAGDPARRRVITGPCQRSFADAYREIYESIALNAF